MVPNQTQISQYLAHGGSAVEYFHINSIEVSHAVIEMRSAFEKASQHLDSAIKKRDDIVNGVVCFASDLIKKKAYYNQRRVINLWMIRRERLESAIKELEGTPASILINNKLTAEVKRMNKLINFMMTSKEERDDSTIAPDETIVVFSSNPFNQRVIMEALFWWRRRYDYNRTVAQMLREVRYNSGVLYLRLSKPVNTDASTICTRLALQMNISWYYLRPCSLSVMPPGVVMFDKAERLPRFDYNEAALKIYNPLKSK